MSLPPPAHGVRPIQTIRWINNPFQVMSEHQARYGDAFTIRLPAMPAPLVLVSDPDVVKQVFALGPDEGHAGKANAVLKPFLGQHSLLLLDGSEHLRQRKMMLPAFHGERMHAYCRTITHLSHDSINPSPFASPF